MGLERSMKGSLKELRGWETPTLQRTLQRELEENCVQYRKGMVGVCQVASLGRRAAPARPSLLMGIIPEKLC